MKPRQADMPRDVTLRIVRGRSGLVGHVPAWNALSAQALDTNIFYEPAMVLATLDHLGLPGPLCCVLVFKGEEMIGFFPFWAALAGPRGIMRAYRSFEHTNCFLNTPLVHAAHAVAAIDAVLDWLDSAPGGARLLAFHKIAGDTAFADRLRERLRARRQPHFLEGRFERAFLRPAATAADYLATALSKKKRKEYGRQHRRLEEEGRLSVTTTTAREDAARWADDFVRLELRGWKGRGRAAFGALPGGKQYLRTVITHLAGEGRAVLHTMALDGVPIAMKCNFIGCGPRPAGSFAYKIAYDESYARFSPGVLLELYNIEDLHARQDHIAWMDSCANPDHPMIDHLWAERREIHYMICASRGIVGWMMIVLLRLWAWRAQWGRQR